MIPFLNSIQETYGHLPEYIVDEVMVVNQIIRQL